MLASYLLPVLVTLPLWVKYCCIVYQFIFYTVIIYVNIRLLKKTIKRNKERKTDNIGLDGNKTHFLN